MSNTSGSRSVAKRLVHLLCVIALASFTVAASGRRPHDRQAVPKPPSQIDVVASTALKTTPEHQQRYVRALLKNAEIALESLNPETYTADLKPANGNRRYRLIIEHQGKIWFTQPEARTSEGRLIDKTTKRVIEADAFQVDWGYSYGEEGRLYFKLLEWNGTTYRTLRTWNRPVMHRHTMDLVSAIVVPRQPPANVDLPRRVTKLIVSRGIPRIPMTQEELDQAKSNALSRLQPSYDARDILSGLVGCQVLGSNITPTPLYHNINRDKLKLDDIRPHGPVDIRVTNASPWVLRSCKVRCTFGPDGGQVYTVMTDYSGGDNPLAPGKSTVLNFNGIVIGNGTYVPEVARLSNDLLSATFEVAPAAGK